MEVYHVCTRVFCHIVLARLQQHTLANLGTGPIWVVGIASHYHTAFGLATSDTVGTRSAFLVVSVLSIAHFVIYGQMLLIHADSSQRLFEYKQGSP